MEVPVNQEGNNNPEIDYKKELETLSADLKENYIHKKVMAADVYERTRHVLACCFGMMTLTFFCAAMGKNWYSIILGGLSIGWGSVFLVKTIQLRKYLEQTYKVK